MTPSTTQYSLLTIRFSTNATPVDLDNTLSKELAARTLMSKRMDKKGMETARAEPSDMGARCGVLRWGAGVSSRADSALLAYL